MSKTSRGGKGSWLWGAGLSLAAVLLGSALAAVLAGREVLTESAWPGVGYPVLGLAGMAAGVQTALTTREKILLQGALAILPAAVLRIALGLGLGGGLLPTLGGVLCLAAGAFLGLLIMTGSKMTKGHRHGRRRLYKA